MEFEALVMLGQEVLKGKGEGKGVMVSSRPTFLLPWLSCQSTDNADIFAVIL